MSNEQPRRSSESLPVAKSFGNLNPLYDRVRVTKPVGVARNFFVRFRTQKVLVVKNAMIEDAALLRQYAMSRDEAAFTEFVRRHVNLVYFAALRRTAGNAALAEDVAQKVFITAARNTTSLAAHTTVSGWLYTTTRNIASKAIRAEAARQRLEHELLAMHEPTSPESDRDWGRVRPLLDAAMDELNEREREALLLRFFEQQPFARIGAALRISENTARMRVERALDKLRLRLAARGLVSTSAALGAALAHEAALLAPAGLTVSVAGAAFSASAASAFGGLGWLAFMSTSKTIGTMGAAVMLLAAGASVFMVRTDGAAREALAAAQREYAVAETRLQETERQIRSLEEATAASQRQSVVTKPATASSPTPMDPVELGNAVLKLNPELKALLVASRRARIAGRYFPLYRELGLTETAVAEFEEIMMSGVGGITHYDFPGVGTVRLEAATALPPAEKSRRLHELLGESGTRRMQEYQRSLNSYVSRVAGALYCTETPLTVEQGRQLGRVIAEHSVNVGPGKMTPAEYWSPIVAKAGAFLAAPQLQAVAGLQAHDELIWAREQMTKNSSK